MEYETIIMDLIMHGGDARSKSLQSIASARNGFLEEAERLLERATEEINAAHESQTYLIQSEIRGESTQTLSLLMVHAQDHLMNAMTVRDLAIEIVEIIKEKNHV